jgi:hypothetical protein
MLYSFARSGWVAEGNAPVNVPRGVPFRSPHGIGVDSSRAPDKKLNKGFFSLTAQRSFDRRWARSRSVRGAAMKRDIVRAKRTRAEAEELLRDTHLSMTDIARRLGVARQQVNDWNRRATVRPTRVRRDTLEGWSPPRRAALLRLIAMPAIDPGDLAEALGFTRDSVPVLLAFGTGSASVLTHHGDQAGTATPPRRLRALLRAHIGRQIHIFDAALGDPRGGIDSAKVLRDLGGLKRLLDDLDEGPSDQGDGEGEPHDASSRPGHEPAFDAEALRAEIARRYERFVGGGEAA